ncbi:MAG: hypothetical protein LIP28_05325, partial [Deltaproteobacteria bacterium]|nr:hypothetical protein [Deltaproteobacteria bacterium]
SPNPVKPSPSVLHRPWSSLRVAREKTRGKVLSQRQGERIGKLGASRTNEGAAWPCWPDWPGLSARR